MMAYAVARQTQEIGIRLAIGATRADISRMVLRDAVTLVCGAPHRSGDCPPRDAPAGDVSVRRQPHAQRSASLVTVVIVLAVTALFRRGDRCAGRIVDPVVTLRYE